MYCGDPISQSEKGNHIIKFNESSFDQTHTAKEENVAIKCIRRERNSLAIEILCKVRCPREGA